MRVLLIEGDPAYAQSVELELKAKGFDVCTTNEGADGEQIARLYDFDAVVVAATLDRTEFDLVRSLRRDKVGASIIVLSRLPAVPQIVHALNSGADDYMTKPFHGDELAARLEAIVRRSHGHAQSVIEIGNIAVNISTKAASVAGVRVHLTGKEYDILELLSLRKGVTLHKEAFLLAMYGERDEPDIKIIDVFICKLRKKLRAAGADRNIETVWGSGYVLRDKAGSIAPSLAPEMRDMIEDPPTGYVSPKTVMEYRRESVAAGRLKAPSIVSRAGER